MTALKTTLYISFQSNFNDVIIVLKENTQMLKTESINIQNENVKVSDDLISQMLNDFDSEVQSRDENEIKVYVRDFRLNTLTTTYVVKS